MPHYVHARVRQSCARPPSTASSLRDHARSSVHRWDALAQRVAQTVPGVIHADVSSKGLETTFITGAFVLHDPVEHPGAMHRRAGPHHARSGLPVDASHRGTNG